MENDWLYRLALTQVSGIGALLMKALIGHFGEARDVFRAPAATLENIKGIGKERAKAILGFADFQTVEKELAFLEKYKIQPLFFTDHKYPHRLANYNNAPPILFYKGNADLNAPKAISVVGTRCSTRYGEGVTEKFITGLCSPGMLIVSGLAHGIDAAAHKAALKSNLPTVAVLGHGLRQIYPESNRGLAGEIIKEGGLLTQFLSRTRPDDHNFPVRNRIVAGMSDALIVVETACKGGSMLTVENALSCKKKVFAFPGRIGDRASVGCNMLIRDGKARLLTGPRQLLEEMEWEDTPLSGGKTQPLDGDRKQRGERMWENQELRAGESRMDAEEALRAAGASLSREERDLLEVLREKGGLSLDELLSKYRSSGPIAGLLLGLELKGLIDVLPGKIYRPSQ